MAALQFNKCCCCINLRTGALILGYLGIIGSVLMIGSVGVSMSIGTKNGGENRQMPVSIGITTIILFIIGLIFYSLLLAGVYKRKPSFIRANWVYMIVYSVLVSVLQLCSPANQNAPGIIGIIIGLLLSIYMALCVRSYELVLREEGFSGGAQRVNA